MTAPNPTDGSVIGTQIEEIALRMFDVAFTSMVLNGLDREYSVTLVFEHKNPASHFVVGTVGYERSREILKHYVDQKARVSEETAEAMDKMRRPTNG